MKEGKFLSMEWKFLHEGVIMAGDLFDDEEEFTEADEEAAETVAAICLLTRCSQTELLQAAYEGPENGFDLEHYLQGERRY